MLYGALGKYTPLMLTCQSRIHEMARYLIDHGADLDKQNYTGQTALMIACQADQLETVRYLITHGANLHKRDYKNKSALDYAVNNKCHEIAKYLANIEQKHLEKLILKNNALQTSLEF